MGKYIVLIMAFLFASSTLQGTEIRRIDKIEKMAHTGNAITRHSLYNPVGFWKFDEESGATTVDLSGMGNNGTISGATRVTGKIGGGLSFNGVNNSVAIANESNFDFERTQAFSVSAWVKAVAPMSADYAIVTKIDGTKGWYFIIDDSDGCAMLTMANPYPSNTLRKKSSVSVADNTWHHVCFVYGGSSLATGVNISVDGSLSNGSVIYDTLTATVLNDAPPRIGVYTTTGAWFKGLVDDVRIYNRVLTTDEILRLYFIGNH